MTAHPHDMDERQYTFLQHLLTARTGIRFRDRAHLSVKLARRLRVLKLEDFDQYIALIRQEPGEIPNAIEAVTTNETFFCRDSVHLAALERHLDSHLDQGRTYRIWSAASSSGEEVYSIAMTVHAWAETRRIPLRNIKITGSDIDRSVLRRAMHGVYHRYQVERTPKEYTSFVLNYLERDNGDYYRIKPHIRDMVVFKRFNLTQPLPFSHSLDVIFCRNVFLYFSQELRKKILAGMLKALGPEGLLIMGLCESMPYDLPHGFKYTGHSMYIKTH